ncbi:hypothetical protein IFM89_004787 [Coptis chinensis]|uniref:Uncharacterized protein n=1 Tax=Coptis chinensis TaxID=261450 RepID=A0A835HTT9_9MAGN|nr:hypothetical protein IFM89_004787 [Coptis chinensis]
MEVTRYVYEVKLVTRCVHALLWYAKVFVVDKWEYRILIQHDVYNVDLLMWRTKEPYLVWGGDEGKECNL